MQALGTRVRMTVFRKLRDLPYVTSYSADAASLTVDVGRHRCSST
jgi:hypothetical protein